MTTPTNTARLEQTAPAFDTVVNTIPAPVLTEAVLAALRPGSLVVDLASRPGGTDFAAARRLGHRAIHALSLPTACAPETPQSIHGIVTDASMNDILVVTDQGDTVAISTMDADPAKVPGVLVDDSVTVTCIGEKVGGNRILKATELVVTAHSPYYYIQGKWIEPNPINADEVQGFELKQDGTASSINMATLAFQQWNLENGELLLKSQSIGNGQTIEGTDTLRIDKLNADSLVLSRDGNVLWRLARQK